MKRVVPAAILSLIVSSLFFVRVGPTRISPSFRYFLDELEYIETTLDEIGFDPKTQKRGIHDLRSIISSAMLIEPYEACFESDRETAQLTGIYIGFAYTDHFNQPIQIWVGNEEFRVFSLGPDGKSETGGLDADDIWNGDPEKAREFVHRSYDTWYESQQKPLWRILWEFVTGPSTIHRGPG